MITWNNLERKFWRVLSFPKTGTNNLTGRTQELFFYNQNSYYYESEYFLQTGKSYPPPRFSTKIPWITLLAAAFCFSNLTAQTTSAFSIVSPFSGMDADQNKVIATATSSANPGSLLYILWSENLVDNNGNITVTLPTENGGQPITFQVIGFSSQNVNEYNITGKSSIGQIGIFSHPLGKVGTINIGLNSYDILPLGTSKGVVFKKLPPDLVYVLKSKRGFLKNWQSVEEWELVK